MTDTPWPAHLDYGGDKPAPRPRLARALREWRERNGVTQQAFADSNGLSRNQISLIENGKQYNLTIGTVCTIAAGMHITPVAVFRLASVEEIPDEQAWWPVTPERDVG